MLTTSAVMINMYSMILIAHITPELALEFSLVGVLIFWFACYHPFSLDVLIYAVGFNSPWCWSQSYFFSIRPVAYWPRSSWREIGPNLSLKVICDTSHLCQCTVFLKSVCSFVSNVYYSLAESRGSPNGSGGKSIPVASIRKYVDVLFVRIILNTWIHEGRCNFDFVSIWNSIYLFAWLGGSLYLCHVQCSL